MPKQAKPPLTQRAYTLRLRGADSNDQSWRDALWQTHEAVNRGAKAFGDWLLTLRGGLDHSLADAKVKGKSGKPDRDPTDEERKARRILLALSWLSVESKLGAPAHCIIASGTEASEDRNRKVLAALEEILRSRGVGPDEIKAWKDDCSPSLCAAIRDDAVWVNRSKAFDEAVKKFDGLRQYAHTAINCFFGLEKDYLRLPAKINDGESGIGDTSTDGPNFMELARQWVSTNFGTGTKSDNARICNALHTLVTSDLRSFAGCSKADFLRHLASLLGQSDPNKEPEEALRIAIGWTTGRPSASRLAIRRLPDPVTVNAIDTLQHKFADEKAKREEKADLRKVPEWIRTFRETVERECGIPYVGRRDQTDEYSVMLDHAARRVSLAHTWIKRAEAERRKFEEDAKKIGQVPKAAKDWLDQFCLERSGVSGALEPYRIRRRAVDGWKEVVAAWSKSDCKTVEDRIAAARALQDDPEIDKFGDIQLFEALAADDAVCVWHKDGDAAKTPDPQPLIDYALAAEADFKKRHFKVPAYRHPDALLHPIFCDFGKSRWNIRFDAHKNVQTPLPRALSLTLWTGSEMKQVPLCWQSKRLARDLAFGQDARKDGASDVTRADRLGRAASNVGKSHVVNIAGLFEQTDWNGRLQAPRRQLEAIDRYVKKHGWDQKAENMRDAIQWSVTFSARLQPRGPWYAYVKEHGLREDPRYWPHAQENKNRKGHARLILSRLPGLRVLSVDLGHRSAAACAVWEAVTAEQVKEACQAAGQRKPEESDLYLHLKKKVTKQKKGKDVEVEETTIYRRIGADTLPDGTPHPAPWARLDRQFLIKLQGEEEGVREASNEEIWAVHQMEAALGRSVPLIDRLVASGWGATE